MSRWSLSENADRPPSIRSDAWAGFREGLKCLDNAAADIAKAGRLFADISEPQWDRLVANAPAPLRRTLGHCRAVGKGLLMPQLATASGEYVSRLRAFPIADQEKYLFDPVEVTVRSQGSWDTVMQRVTEMDSATIKQVFAKSGRKWTLRTADQQKSWMIADDRREARRQPSAVINRPGRWKVDDGRVYLAAAKVRTGLSRADVEGIQRDLEKGLG